MLSTWALHATTYAAETCSGTRRGSRPTHLRSRRVWKPHPRLLTLRLCRRRPGDSRCAGRVVVKPGEGDDGRRIQAAIDSVAKLPIGADGFRGAVLLAPGQFEVSGQLRISHSGIVLRGSGAGEGGTTLTATGLDRRPLLRIEGDDDRRPRGERQYHVLDEESPSARASCGWIQSPV